MSTPTVTPKSFRQGTTVEWILDPSSDYSPDDGWSLVFRFASTEDSRTVSGSNNGDGRFLVTISASASAGYVVGEYGYVAIVSKSGETFELESGTVEVLPDLTAPVDWRTHARKVYDRICDYIEGNTDGWGVASYTISTPNGSRSLTRMSPAEVIRWRDYWKRQLDAEERASRIAKGLNARASISVRMP